MCTSIDYNTVPRALGLEYDEVHSALWNPLAEEVNALSARLVTFSSDDRQKLDEWRDNAFELIERVYEQKCDELKQRAMQRKARLQTDVNQLRSRLTKSISEEELVTLKLNIDDVKRKVTQFEEQPMEIHAQPLVIDEKTICIEESKTYELDLTKLALPYRKISCSDQSWPAMCANDRCLLVDQSPHLILYDRDLKIIRQLLWAYGFIRNMCWSSTCDCFIIINNEKEVFLLRETCLSIDRFQTVEEQYWWSCTCSESSLFLTNTTMGTNIFQFNLIFPSQLVQRWKPPQSCKKHEYIDDISYHNGTLALVIKVSSTNTVQFDLRSSTTLDCLWSVPLDVNKSWFQQTIRALR